MPRLEDAIAALLVNDRVCPAPMRWDSLYKLLCKVAEDKMAAKPPVPLILGAWWYSSPTEKTERLISQLSWGSDHGALEQAMSYLARLPENDWVHLADAPSGIVNHDHLDENEW